MKHFHILRISYLKAWLIWLQQWPLHQMGPNLTSCRPMYTVSLSVSNWQLATVLLVISNPHGWLCVQIPQLVINGGRPEIPSRSNLPGPDTASFASLDAYLALMRWVGSSCECSIYARAHLIISMCIAGTVGNKTVWTDRLFPRLCLAYEPCKHASLQEPRTMWTLHIHILWPRIYGHCDFLDISLKLSPICKSL